MLPGTDLESAKREARRQARARRAVAAREMDAGGRLADRLEEAALIRPGTVVSAFWPLDGEIDTRPLMTRLHEKGCKMALPVMQGPGKPLLFRAWQPGDELRVAAFDTREPSDDEPLREPSVVLVPMLAFDRAGFRLGYGGGFYDRTLAQFRERRDILAIGIAFAGQEVDAVPRGPFDQRLDWVVTEQETITTGWV